MTNRFPLSRITTGVSFWIGAFVGYSTGQRTVQQHLRAKIIADVKPCHKLPQLAAIICRLNTISGPKGLDLCRSRHDAKSGP